MLKRLILKKQSINLYVPMNFQGFWQKIETFEEQPDIHFEHDLIVQLETEDPDKTLSWSTMNNYNSHLENRIRTPTIQVRKSQRKQSIFKLDCYKNCLPLSEH